MLYHLQVQGKYRGTCNKKLVLYFCNDCELTHSHGKKTWNRNSSNFSTVNVSLFLGMTVPGILPCKDSHEMYQRPNLKYLLLVFTTTIPAFTNWLLFIYVRRPEVFSLCSIDFLPHLLFINYAFLKVWNVKWVLWEDSNFDTSCHKVGNFLEKSFVNHLCEQLLASFAFNFWIRQMQSEKDSWKLWQYKSNVYYTYIYLADL